MVDDAWGVGDGGGIEHGMAVADVGGCWPIFVAGFRQGLNQVPLGIMPSGKGLADPRHAVTQADITIAAARLAELDKEPIFLGDDERRFFRWGWLIH